MAIAKYALLFHGGEQGSANPCLTVTGQYVEVEQVGGTFSLCDNGSRSRLSPKRGPQHQQMAQFGVVKQEVTHPRFDEQKIRRYR